MKFAPLCFCAGLASLSVLSAASPASAFIAGINLTGGQIFDDARSYTLGWEFNVNRAIKIDALGIFDGGSPGLNGSYTLGLWDLGGNLLASTSVSGVGDGIDNSFVWKSLASVLSLAPGNYVVGAAGDYLANLDLFAYDGTFATLSGVSFIESRYVLGDSLQYPVSTFPVVGYFGGNFSEAPVPGPLPLFGAAAAFGWTRRLRSRVRQASSGLGQSSHSEAV